MEPSPLATYNAERRAAMDARTRERLLREAMKRLQQTRGGIYK